MLLSCAVVVVLGLFMHVHCYNTYATVICMGLCRGVLRKIWLGKLGKLTGTDRLTGEVDWKNWGNWGSWENWGSWLKKLTCLKRLRNHEPMSSDSSCSIIIDHLIFITHWSVKLSCAVVVVWGCSCMYIVRIPQSFVCRKPQDVHHILYVQSAQGFVAIDLL